MTEKVPQAYVVGRYTYVDAKVKLNPGLCAQSAAKIGHYLVCERKIDQEVFIARADKLNVEVGTRAIMPKLEEIASAKSIMGLMVLELAQDCDVRIFVDGEDRAARDLALNIYSALTTEKEYLDNEDFDRFKDR
jgi:phosphotransferase system HPr-like phosphotransfer protein